MLHRIALTCITLSLIAVGAFWLHSSKALPDTSSASSQQDVAPDLSSTKSYYDFALSALGEANLEQIQQNVSQQAQQQTELTLSAELFDLYIQYKAALAELPALPSGQISPLDLEQLHLDISQLQQQFFTPQQIALLFNDDNLLRELAIEKAWAAQSQLDPMQKQYLVDDKLMQMPDYIQDAEKNAKFVNELHRVTSLNEQQRYARRVELVGEQGAQRLSELDQQRATFQKNLMAYLSKRDQLLNDGLDSELEQQLAELKAEYFEVKQLKRVEALERLHDQGITVGNDS
ncbi:lipase secretion chaperone [Vibrio sinaloensis]|uniref:lipase secretion chaperone n=1 Tax=Photobacterium sp. (strain ATCC 43367) TaxID=379097 RepID=UPI00205B4FE9|nr:lipase secretion chaperone [Vibrio sinaloensis]UPQ86979.1 lipase chaperone [Vibrio sinaloensis]